MTHDSDYPRESDIQAAEGLRDLATEGKIIAERNGDNHCECGQRLVAGDCPACEASAMEDYDY